LSIMMQSSNQRCNLLQMIVGLFLHSCNVPETAHEFLACIGLSVSVTTINNIISNLSDNAEEKIKSVGSTTLTSYAYDSLDINLKHSVPTVENPEDTLIHLTTGTMLPLQHGVTLNDLNCSDYLWSISPHNRSLRSQDLPNPISLEQLLFIHPDKEDPPGFWRRDQFNMHQFLSDLVHHGPEYFHQYQTKLDAPEVVEAIKPDKTYQVPL
ncbi:hypothetical protein BDQ17DRAFT_1251070, partial [Cyathus striatus]